MKVTCTTLSDTANLLSVTGGIDVYCAADLKSTFVRSSGSNRLPFILDLAGILPVIPRAETVQSAMNDLGRSPPSAPLDSGCYLSAGTPYSGRIGEKNSTTSES